MILAPCVRVKGVFLIIERHTWADDIQNRNAIVSQGGLEDFLDLLRVTRKRTRYKRGVGHQRLHANINRHVWILTLLLELQAALRGCRKLAFCKSVNAIVLNDVDQVYVSAHDVLELSHADAGGIPITRNA